MAEEIRVVPANLREAAGQHREVADYLADIPSSHPAIQDSLDSLGPIFAGLREAARDVLEQRRRCYLAQAEAHAELAANLTTSADRWEQHDQAAAEAFRGVGDDSR